MKSLLSLSILTLSVACLPLVTATGRNFEYEYSLLVSLFLLLGFPAVLLLLARKEAVASGWLTGGKGKLIAFAALAGPILLGLPGFLAFASGWCPCSPGSFRLWFFINILPAWAWAIGLSLLAAATPAHEGLQTDAPDKQPSWSPRWSRLALVQGAVIAYMAARLWLNPQKRGYFPGIGFLHGPIYDELIELDWGVVYGALAASAAALALYATACRRRAWKVMLAGAAAAGALAFYTLAAGFASSQAGHAALQAELPERLDGERYQVFFAGAAQKKAAEDLFREAGFHLLELRQALGIAEHPTVLIYLYPDDRRKKLIFGAGETDVTDVVTPSIHISPSPAPYPTLRHELVHALLAAKAPFKLGFNPNMLITEGAAEALAPRLRDLSLDLSAANIIGTGKIKDTGRLFSPLFWLESGPRAYTVAGSFMAFLLRKQGAQALLRLYGGDGFHGSFGKPRNALLREWEEEIKAGYDPGLHDLTANTLFADEAIFEERCPHTRALYRLERGNDVFLQAARPPGWDPRTDFDPWLSALAPGDRRHRYASFLRAARKAVGGAGLEAPNPALTGLIREISPFALAADANADKPAGRRVLWDHYLTMLLADLQCLEGNPESALETMSTLAAGWKHRHLPVNYKIAGQARLEALTQDGMTGAELKLWCRTALTGRKEGDLAGRGDWLRLHLFLNRLLPAEETDALLNSALDDPRWVFNAEHPDVGREAVYRRTIDLIRDRRFTEAAGLIERRQRGAGAGGAADGGYADAMDLLYRYALYGANTHGL